MGRLARSIIATANPALPKTKSTRNYILRVACTRSEAPFLHITCATPEIVTESLQRWPANSVFKVETAVLSLPDSWFQHPQPAIGLIHHLASTRVSAGGGWRRRHRIRGISRGRETTGSLDNERQKDWSKRSTRSQSPRPFLQLGGIAPGDYCEGASTYQQGANCRVQTHSVAAARTNSTHTLTHSRTHTLIHSYRCGYLYTSTSRPSPEYGPARRSE